MVQAEQATISVSGVELTYLARLLGANMLLGVNDPFWGWLADEIEEAWRKAKDDLAARRYIAPQDSGGLIMDTAVAALVGTAAFPRASFVLTITRPGAQPEVCYFHVTSRLAIQQTPAGDAYSLTALDNAQAVYEQVATMLALAQQAAAPGKGGEVSEAELGQAQAAVKESGAGGCEAALIKAGLDKKSAAALAETLAHPIRNASLVGLARRAGRFWEVAGMGILDGQNGLWRLRSFTRDEENLVEARPGTAAQAKDHLRRVMNRVLEEQLAERAAS